MPAIDATTLLCILEPDAAAPIHPDLERAKTHIPAGPDPIEHLGRLHPPAGTGAPVKRNGRARRATEEPEDRQTGFLAHEVPQGDVDDSHDPTGHPLEDIVAAEREGVPVAVDLERVFADEDGLDDLFEIGAENRFPFRDDRIRAWGFGPSFDADVGLDAQQVLAHLEGG